MKDPVFLTSGHTYEREAVVSFLKEKGAVDPKTGQSVNPSFVVENINLKESLAEFMAAHPDLQKSLD